MKKNLKVALIVSFSLILLGCAVFSFAMMKLNWNFDKISIGKYETNEYVIREKYFGIYVNTNTADVEFVVSEDDTTKVVCFEQSKVKHTVEIFAGDLSIKAVDTRKWYERVDVSFFTPKITIYLPKGKHYGLSVYTSTGDCTVPGDLTFGKINILTDTGNVKNYASTEKSVFIKTETGNITTENISVSSIDIITSTGKITANNLTAKGTVRANVSTGKLVAQNINCTFFMSEGSTGDVELNSVVAPDWFSIKRSTGDVEFIQCNSKDIFIETDTGDVTGSLPNRKEFVTKTYTGKVSVPESYANGGRCEVITDTGDIDIQIYW